ncbi:MAG: nucleotidyltransferase domain-containing protein [Promethearchaeota archaeon]
MLYLYQNSIISNLKSYGQKDKNLHQIIIYGSYARNEHGPESDIDVLIITDNIPESEKYFSKFRSNTYIETSVMISFFYLTPYQYTNGKEPFVNQIKKEGKIIWSINKKI